MEHLAASSALDYLNKASSKKVSKNENGWYELRMNRLYQFIGISVGIMGLSFLYLTIGEQHSSSLMIILVISLGFSSLGLTCFLWYRNHKLRFNDTTIIALNVYGKPSSLSWDDITDISFNGLSGQITLVGKDANTVKAHQHLVGLGSFVELIESKTKWTAKSLRLPINKII